MTSKIKKILFWIVVIVVPCGILGIIGKYFYDKKNGKDVKPEEVVAQTVNFIRRVFNIVAH